MRSAVFVDAGYVYAQGSVSCVGRKLSRREVELDLGGFISHLRGESQRMTDNVPLLRIYWYDGLTRGGMSPDQRSLASTDDVKLRLGVVNSFGEQKGVDSLIVTDLVELARNHGITDAVLLSGDEDIRIGVEIAQSFGVRVHLIGIEPSRGSQSQSLREEADTTSEISSDTIRALMTCSPMADTSIGQSGDHAVSEVSEHTSTTLRTSVVEFISRLPSEDIETIGNLGQYESIPRLLDGRLLATCGSALGRRLSLTETNEMRNIAKAEARNLATNLFQPSNGEYNDH